MTTTTPQPFEQWGILEIMGHRRLGGLVTEEERFGTKMARVDIPPVDADGQTITQYYGGTSIYSFTITDEETARAFAQARRERPIDEWSARRMLDIQATATDVVDEADFDEDDPEL